MSYSVKAGDFSSLETAWDSLLSKCSSGHVFFTPQWQRAWWQAFGAGSDLELLSVEEGDTVVGIAPLRRAGKRVSFIGSPDVCDYMDFVIRPGSEGSALSALLDYLEPADWQTMDLHSLLPDSICLTRFAPLAEERGYSVETTVEDVSPQVTLPADWDGYLSLLKRKDRHELRRKMRRLSHAKPRFHTVTEGQELSHGLKEFLRLFELARDDKRQFMSDEMKDFFISMTHSVASRGFLRLAFLEAEGKPVATAICFDCWDHFHLYNSGYDPTYGSLSVGLLCKAFCIQEGILEGKKHFDFLRGAEPYKYDLGGRDVPICRCVITRG